MLLPNVKMLQVKPQPPTAEGVAARGLTRHRSRRSARVCCGPACVLCSWVWTTARTRPSGCRKLTPAFPQPCRRPTLGLSQLPEIGIIHLGALLIGGGLLGLAGWLGWRFPTVLLLLALATLAIRPQIHFGAPDVGIGWGLHQSLLLVALLVNAAKHGVRKTVNWPILALVAVFALNLAFSDLDPKVKPVLMASAFGVLALPWAFTQVALAPGSRRVLAVTIASLAVLSVAIEALLALLGIRDFFEWRLEGMTGNAAVFALLAFTGFAVALHEWTRRSQPFLGVLAALNLALVVLSGTRMAIFTSALFLAVYLVASPSLLQQWRERWFEMAIGAGLVSAAAWYYWPMLRWRAFESGGDRIRLSGRDELWPFYYDQFLMSPTFGRGLGSGFVGALYWLDFNVSAPHNEYLHLLVVGGVVGAATCFLAIFLWFRQLWRRVAATDRTILIALLPAWASYAAIDNVLIYTTGLALFAYLGVLLTRRGRPARGRECSRSSLPAH
jgi:O-antigen ligase